MQSDWLNSALSPVVYGVTALSINTQYKIQKIPKRPPGYFMLTSFSHFLLPLPPRAEPLSCWSCFAFYFGHSAWFNEDKKFESDILVPILRGIFLRIQITRTIGVTLLFLSVVHSDSTE